jgi:hypothetical protein
MCPGLTSMLHQRIVCMFSSEVYLVFVPEVEIVNAAD